MTYNPSVNIEYGISSDFDYIVTPNAEKVTGELVASFNSGVHSFSVIGTYGTGKSSYLMALERDLFEGANYLIQNRQVFGKDIKGYACLNILGDYDSLKNILSRKLNCEISDNNRNIFDSLSSYYDQQKKESKLLFIVIDEFGKILEHAAKNNPEQELYFLQRLAEFVNVPTRNIILLTTLHQNFGAYAQKLTETQKNEWNKVKGRYKELAFSEPVEQLLFLAAEKIDASNGKCDEMTMKKLLSNAQRCRFVSASFRPDTLRKLYPLDALSSLCITKAIQRYGQNERTLFSFLTSSSEDSLSNFKPSKNETFNLAKVYDYLIYNFFSALNEVNADSMYWTSLRVAIERVESGIISEILISDCLKMVKAIGLLNLFGSASTTIDEELLTTYGRYALNITNPASILKELIKFKIIRYAVYKSSYILFEGTDIDLENELYKAANVVPKPDLSLSTLLPYVNQKAIAVSEEYYRSGTPRYFEYVVRNEASAMLPQNDIDGYVELVFPMTTAQKDSVSEVSKSCSYANVFVVFNNTEEIIKHLYEITKLNYLNENVVVDYRVAKREVENLLAYEQSLLNNVINGALVSQDSNCTWFYKGEEAIVDSWKTLNKLLNRVVRDVYNKTPIIRNELFNRQKLSSAISLARVKLLDAMLENSDKEDFGFAPDTCPPEKTIYYTLFKSTGIHRQNEHGDYVLGAPQNDLVKSLWRECEKFIASTVDKPRKLSELFRILKSQPFKLKQGVIDFWIPIFLYVKQEDFAMYNGDGTYVMNINKEVFELIQKRPAEFEIKAFNVSGVKIEFYKTYRRFLNKDTEQELGSSSFIETFKPFLQYYRRLNDYAKNTHKFDSPVTANFRDVLAKAKDPEKAFFEDIPAAFGYSGSQLMDDSEFVGVYLAMIRKAVKELNNCYPQLINRIKARIIEELSIPEDIVEYKLALEDRYGHVKKHLLTDKTRTFLERVLAPAESDREFFEKIGSVIFDKPLTQLRDKEEELLIDNMIYLLHELDRHVEISAMSTGDEEVFNFELASSNRSMHQSQTYRLPDNQRETANAVSSKIDEMLTGDDNLDVCILLKLLNKKLSK